jgi:hypothetical protein
MSTNAEKQNPFDAAALKIQDTCDICLEATTGGY